MLMACLDDSCMVMALAFSLSVLVTYAFCEVLTIGQNYFFGVCGVVASAHPADLRGGGGLANAGLF